MLNALAIITSYGVRISAFHNFEAIQHDRIRITNYKGKGQTLPCASVDIEKFKNAASHYKDTKSLEVNLIKFLKKCHAIGLAANAYSPHDFRHLYACNLYKQDKGIIRVSVALNHSNIAVTDTYIANLKRNGGIDTPSTPTEKPIASASLKETVLKDTVKPTAKEFTEIITAYQHSHNKDTYTALNALRLMARYNLTVGLFHTATINDVFVRTVVDNGDELCFFTIKMTDKDIVKFKNVTSHYKDTKSLEANLIKFLKKCHAKGLAANAYSPNDFCYGA